MIFHKNSKKFLELNGNFTLKNNQIKYIKNKNTFAHHGEFYHFEINNQDIILKDFFTVYLNGQPTAHAPFLNHIAFFEAVRESDFNLAKKYLSPIFNSILTPAHYKNFFGNFDEIRPLNLHNKNQSPQNSIWNKENYYGRNVTYWKIL